MLRLKRFILLFFLLVGCQSRELLPKTTGVEYFPVRVGAFWIYDIVETVITQLGGQTNNIYNLRVQAIDSVSLSGQTTYVLARSKRADATQPWTNLDTWSVRLDQFQMVEQQGNISYVKLSFPLAEGKSWNGNALNNMGGPDKCADGTFHCENYVVADINKHFESTGVSYDNSVTIIENNDLDSIVRQDVRKSVYVKKIGLVYRELSVLEYCTIGSCAGNKVVENGSIIKQTLKEYGGL